MKNIKNLMENVFYEKTISPALLLEEYIVEGLNGNLNSESIPKSNIKTISNIIKDLNELGITGEASMTARNDKKKKLQVEVTKEYNKKFFEYGGKRINKEPKTDFLTNNGEMNISLKGPGGGWIFAHKTVDAKICFDYLVDNDTIIEKSIINMLKELTKVRPPDNFKQNEKGKDIKDFETYVDSFDGVFDSLYEKMNSLFNTNEFKQNFVSKGASGEFKFGKNTTATATHILYIDSSKSGKKVSDVFKDSSLYGGARMYDFNNTNTLGQMITNIGPKFLFINDGVNFWVQKKPKKEWNESMNEGITDWIKKGYQKIKAIFSYLYDLLKKGVSVFLKTMGIYPQIEFNNNL